MGGMPVPQTRKGKVVSKNSYTKKREKQFVKGLLPVERFAYTSRRAAFTAKVRLPFWRMKEV